MPMVRGVDLHFDGDKMLFSGMDSRDNWAVFEVKSDGSGLKQMSPGDQPDVEYFDGCYLPNDKVVLASTAFYVGVPCLYGNNKVCSLYLLEPESRQMRQLTFDQDHNNDPVVMNDGRVLFQRWEYSDIPHYFSRCRMTMNPDGTGQLALHGSNSWFPTSYRFARPIPGYSSRLIGVMSGHHCHNEYGDVGRLAIIDAALGTGYPFRYKPDGKKWG